MIQRHRLRRRHDQYICSEIDWISFYSIACNTLEHAFAFTLYYLFFSLDFIFCIFLAAIVRFRTIRSMVVGLYLSFRLFICVFGISISS